MCADLTRLMAELEYDDPAARAAAAERLCRLGGAARLAAVALVCASGDAAEEVREWAVAALEDLGPPDPADIGDLARLALHETTDVAYWATTLLGRAREDAKAAVGDLAQALADHGAMTVRQRAAWALGKIGPAAAPALPSLQDAARSDNPRLARLASQAIQQIGG